jgi:DNA-binding Lrp family transcriptional regulator
MKSHQLSELSANLNRAISPIARKRDATAWILDQVEPLPQLIKPAVQPVPTRMAESAKSADSPTQAEKTDSDSVKGELRIPYLILDALIPTLSPAESLVYLRLFRLAYGFNHETCTASIWKIGRAVNLSERTTHRAIYMLEQRGLIKRTGHVFGRKGGGLIFKVNRPPITNPKVGMNPKWTEDQQDSLIFDSEEQESSPMTPNPHLQEVKTIYERETNNRWKPSDSAAYEKVKHVKTEKINQAIIAAKTRAASRPNSFSYFVKETLDQANPSSQSRTARKHALKKIIDRIRYLHIGAHNYTNIDFIEDVKIACTREGVAFDNDLFNELMQ